MAGSVVDLAQRRYENALALFDEFVRAAVRDPDAATLRGLERRFAERLEIQPSYWSQIKSRSRQIGERLARQFEQRCHKPSGWMDATRSVPGPGCSACSARRWPRPPMRPCRRLAPRARRGPRRPGRRRRTHVRCGCAAPPVWRR